MSRLAFGFFVLLLALVTRASANPGSPTWDVAVVFAGSDMTDEYQADVDRNVLELARTEISSKLRLKIVRAFPDRWVSFEPDPRGPTRSWDALFHVPPVTGVRVGGRWKSRALDRSLWSTPAIANDLSDFFSATDSRRLLVVYGHGEGARGLRSLSTIDLRRYFEKVLPSRASQPALDVLWLDSCFMANLEFAYELRNLTKYYVSSQEAEFTAGLPFQDLDLVTERDPEDVARELATKFIESYSRLARGSQSGVVERSSATISVIDVSKLEGLISALKEDRAELLRDFESRKSRWNNRFAPIRMEKPELVDLGRLLKFIPSRAAGILELNGRRVFRTTPRVKISNVPGGSHVVFGYEGWRRGQEGDKDVLENLPSPLRATSFHEASPGLSFPMIPLKKRYIFNPFTVGKQQFDWMIVDQRGQLQAGPFSAKRTDDLYVTVARRADNPIRFFATTDGIGAASERYSGLNVVNPLAPAPFLEYYDLEFDRAVKWAQ